MIDENALKTARNMTWQLLRFRYKENNQSEAVFTCDKIIEAYEYSRARTMERNVTRAGDEKQ